MKWMGGSSPPMEGFIVNPASPFSIGGLDPPTQS